MKDIRRKIFIRKLAEFLAANSAGKSIALELESKRPPSAVMHPWAHEWADLRSASPLMGYVTVDEAEQSLTAFMQGD